MRIVMAALSAVVFALAACSSAAHHPAASSTASTAPKPTPTASTRTFGPTQGGSGFGNPGGVAGNPVDLLHTLPGCKTKDRQGQPAPDGLSRYANGWWGVDYWSPSTDPNTGKLTWGQGITVWTYPSQYMATLALRDVTPRDHMAVLVGGPWLVELQAGSTDTFDPSPQTVAGQLGGKVSKVWP